MIRYHKFTYYFLLLLLIFGVLLYDFLILQVPIFTYTDEVLILLLALYSIQDKYSKETKKFITIFLFYVAYSLIYGVAIFNAIIMDALIILKPFLAYYITTSLNLGLKDKEKHKIKYFVLVLSAIVFITTLFDSSTDFMYQFFGHPSRYATFYEIMGFTYIYCSKRHAKDIVVMFILFACGLLSMRSKCYGFIAFAFFFVYFIKGQRFYKLSLKNVVLISICFCIAIIVVWEKLSLYFIEGYGGDISSSFARPALYMICIPILIDYFPFGPGFGSYACYASGQYYSPIYAQYNLDVIYGLTPDGYNFVSDTFFPQIVQFGIVGVLFFFFFFKKRFNDSLKYYIYNKDIVMLKISILFIMFFIIESTTDSTFVQNRGMVAMFIWSLFLNEFRKSAVNKITI